MSSADLFVSGVYVLYILAPIVRDELWLRWALFANSLGFAAWGLWINSWPVVVANALFCLISLRHIHRAWEERQPADLDAETARIGRAVFPGMSDRDLEALWTRGLRHSDSPARLTELGQTVDALYVVVEGEVHVHLADGRSLKTAVADEGHPVVVGEVTTLNPDIAAATATVDVTNATYWKWSSDDLAELAVERPTMVAPFLRGLSRQMAQRVLREPIAS